MENEVKNLKGVLDVVNVTEVSQTTGEVIQYEKAIYSHEHIEESKKRKNYVLSQQECHKFINSELGNFFMYFYENVSKVEGLQNQYKIRYIMLSTYCAYDTNYLTGQICDEPTNKFMCLKKRDLKKILGLSDTEFLKTIKELINHKLLTQEDDGRFSLNQEYTSKGTNKNIKHKYTRIFIENFRKLYWNTKPSSHKKLYTFFLLIPYINVQSNILCKDIYEKDIKNITPITLSDITKTLGIDKTHSTRFINDLRKFNIDGQYIIGRFDTYGQQVIIINPKLYYGGKNIEDLRYIMGLFAI